jgi:hypothetical protein
MFGSVAQRVHWPLGLVAALGFVLLVSSAEAANPGDPFILGVVNGISGSTELSGSTADVELVVRNDAGSQLYSALYAEASGPAVVGQSRGNASAVIGANLPGVAPGVYGIHNSRDGVAAGVEGDTASTSNGAVGVLGKVTSAKAGVASAGVEGDTASTSNGAVGVLGKVTSATSGGSFAVRGINNGQGARGVGVYGSQDGSGFGVFGFTPGGRGVYGFSGGGVGVFGESSTGNGIEASSPLGHAGFFRGDVQVNGVMDVSGTLNVNGDISASGWKTFRIDNPLDPKHKYLRHAAVESNQVLNIYSGNITTDQHGIATVRLPAYFDRINTDLRYQLTVVGQFAQAIIAQKEKGNRFVIRTNKPRVEVSWQVTARRNDAYMRAHPFHEIQTKTKADQALTAKLPGKPASQAPR